jgi:hypothetical protein
MKNVTQQVAHHPQHWYKNEGSKWDKTFWMTKS